jgi:hypothetical protein
MSEIYLDEVDKFNVTKRRNEEGEEVEADACELADERATEFQYPKRVRASTPTLEGGRIWGDLMSSDLHRRHVPCPLCGRHHPSSRLVVIAWSERFTILPKTYGYGTPFEPGSAIPLAFVEWDKEARRIDGGWDLERVEKSAGYLCPHCNNRFQDDQKIWQDQEGKWFPTKQGEPDAHGFHLPSWYANHHQTTAGSLAKEFLKAKSSLAGPRNFVNSKCAEAFAFQGASINRVGKVAQHIEVTGEWLKIITVDYQQNAPYFWAVVRAWNGSNGTHGIEYRFFNNWYELDDLQKKHKVIATALGVDVGFQQPEVLQNCANIQMPTRCSLGDSIQGQLPECIGWTPMKSFGGKKLMRDDATGLYLPYRIKRDQDPYAGTDLAKTMRIELLEWLNDVFFDMLENIRAGKTGLAWTISPEMDTEEYHKHWAGVHRVFERGDPRAYKWKKRDSRWPEHIAKCEAMNLVMAYRLQLISFEAIATKENKPKEETPCLETSKSL